VAGSALDAAHLFDKLRIAKQPPGAVSKPRPPPYTADADLALPLPPYRADVHVSQPRLHHPSYHPPSCGSKRADTVREDQARWGCRSPCCRLTRDEVAAQVDTWAEPSRWLSVQTTVIVESLDGSRYVQPAADGIPAPGVETVATLQVPRPVLPVPLQQSHALRGPTKLFRVVFVHLTEPFISCGYGVRDAACPISMKGAPHFCAAAVQVCANALRDVQLSLVRDGTGALSEAHAIVTLRHALVDSAGEVRRRPVPHICRRHLDFS